MVRVRSKPPAARRSPISNARGRAEAVRAMADAAVSNSAASISSSTMRRCGAKTFAQMDYADWREILDDVTLDGRSTA